MQQYKSFRQLDMPSTTATVTSPGFLPMEVAQTSFLVDRLGTDCGPEFLRELTQNSIEASVRVGERSLVIWHGQQVGASRKLTITDTGDGMTGEELERHINRLSASGTKQDLAGNFGVGAEDLHRALEPRWRLVSVLETRRRARSTALPRFGNRPLRAAAVFTGRRRIHLSSACAGFG